MSINHFVDTLDWLLSAIRQRNYIGAESVIADMVNGIKNGNISELDLPETKRTVDYGNIYHQSNHNRGTENHPKNK